MEFPRWPWHSVGEQDRFQSRESSQMPGKGGPSPKSQARRATEESQESPWNSALQVPMANRAEAA